MKNMVRSMILLGFGWLSGLKITVPFASMSAKVGKNLLKKFQFGNEIHHDPVLRKYLGNDEI